MWTTRPAPPVASFTTTPGAVVESEQVAIDVPPFTSVPLATSIDDSAVMVVGRPSQTGCEATPSVIVPAPTTLDGLLPTKRSDSSVVQYPESALNGPHELVTNPTPTAFAATIACCPASGMSTW